MTRALTLTLLLISPALSAFAQPGVMTHDRFSIELWGDGDYATQDLGAANPGAGFGFDVAVSYRFMPHVSAYAGWGWHRFASADFIDASEVDAEETGYTFGLRFAHPFGTSPLGYYVQAGGTYDHIEFEDADGDLVLDTGHGLGWQAGAGLVVPLTSNADLMPGVRYTALSRSTESGGSDTDLDLDLTYVAVRLGFALSF